MVKQIMNEELHAALKTLILSEKKLTAQIIEHIAEVDRRKLYLQKGCTSLFQYLTDLGYAPASAQRRIDAARLHNKIPTVAEDIETGRLNLSQISLVAQGVKRKKDVSSNVIKDLLNEVKGKDVRQCEVKVNQVLSLEPVICDKKRFQRDESVRVEMTLSKEQWELLEIVKRAMSHIDPNPSMAVVFEKLAKEFLRRRDPIREVSKKRTESDQQSSASDRKLQDVRRQNANGSKFNIDGEPDHRAKNVGAKIKRLVFKRDSCCQWRAGRMTKRICRFFVLYTTGLSISERWTLGPSDAYALL